MNQQAYIYFNELPVKAMFYINGNTCLKMSTKTAKVMGYKKTFYFAKKDLCLVSEYSRLALDYFKRVA